MIQNQDCFEKERCKIIMKNRIIAVLVFIAIFASIFPTIAVAAILDTDNPFIAASAGADFVLALQKNGNLWAWGANDHGQVGNGDTTLQYYPVRIMDSVKFISAGWEHSLAIKEDRSLWAWGDNYAGQLGTGVVGIDKSLPVKIMENVIAAAADTFHSVAVTADNRLWYWGDAVDLITKPVQVMDDVKNVQLWGYGHPIVLRGDDSLYYVEVIHGRVYGEPVRLAENVKDFVASSNNLIVLLKDGSVRLWESQPTATNDVEVPKQCRTSIKAVSASPNTVSMIKENGDLYEWWNVYEWGDAETSGFPIYNWDTAEYEVYVVDFSTGPITRKLSNCVYVARNEDILYWGVAIKTDGSLWQWGLQTGSGVLVANFGYPDDIPMGAYIMTPAMVFNSRGETVADLEKQMSTPDAESTSNENESIVSVVDVLDSPSLWAASEVGAAIEARLVPENLRKNYTSPISRGNVAQMFINLLENASGMTIDEFMAAKGVSINNNAFTDTSDKAVLAANALGIINGVGGGRFDPNGTLTRAQIAAIINRVAGALGIDTKGFSHSFADVKGHWVDAELGWPSSVGIINGRDATTFDPNGNLTTQEAIAITYRASVGGLSGGNKPKDAPSNEKPEEVSYYDTLSGKQKQMLSRLEAALRATDYQTAYSIQSTVEFRALCDAIPGLGSFWYYPDIETSILVCYQQHEGERGYSMEIYEGRNGKGRYLCGRDGGWGGEFQNYVFHIADYSGGKANGPFSMYVLNYSIGETKFHTQSGNLREGAAYGPVFIEMDGETFEQEYEADWYNWWPDWPQGR